MPKKKTIISQIRQLSSTNPLASIPHHIFYQTPIPPPPQPLPALAHNHGTAALSRANPAHRPLPDQKTFELFAYRAFIGAITSQLRQFNDRVLRTPQRDSAELFTAMCRAVDVPLSSRISDVEKYCEAVLIDNDFEDGDELMHRLDNFIRESRREKILELTNELEVIMPLIRDAAANARENIKVCNVFTQWSRQFGDLLRKSSFSAATLFQAIDDLKNQFAESHMSRHWLPPSITPILRLAALELEKRDGVVTPSTSPLVPATVLDRKKSIDMTLDSCISQVEAIVHEIDYHVIRLCNKARDYSSFQSLDLDSVTRISKVVDSMKSSIDQLAEHSFKEEPTRPNSVLFVEITNEDITKTMKKSDSEGSQGSLRKVSVAPKISDPLSENDEILAEQRRIEEQMKDVIDRIGKSMGEETHFEKSNEGSITVDFGILKTLINQSENLLLNFEFCRPKENNPDPPMIVVDSEEEKEEEEKSVKKLMENVKSSKENDPHSETPIPTRDSPDMTSPDDSEAFGSQKSPKTSISHQEEGEEEEKNKDEEDNAQEDRGSTNSEANNDLINDQSEQQTVVSPTNENPQGQSSPNSLQDQKGQEEPTSLESTDATSPLPSENTIQKEQTSLESSPQNKSPEENVPELQMVRHSQSADKMTSHLRSHINTANGKPHVTYQVLCDY
uniref:Uncharacterized protein n=1 Tax=Caenorhabditis japonica TaxID=281687 RepID=A0A8R1DN18_CAEJA